MSYNDERDTIQEVVHDIFRGNEDGGIRHHSTTKQIIAPYMPRTDGKTPQEMYGGLIAEGSRLCAARVIEIPGGKKIHLVSTVAASPHTPLRIPYDVFETSWKNHNGRDHTYQGALVPVGTEDGQEITRSYSPLHMIVWSFVEDVDGRFISLDPNDMSAYVDPEDDISISENDIRRQFALLMGEEKMNEFFLNLHEMVGTARDVLLDLYNNSFRTKFPLGFKEKTVEDVLQGYAYGFGGGDKSKGLAQGMGEGGDGTGRGPMSAPTFHYHVCMHLSQEEMDEINQASPDYSYNDIIAELRRYPEHFGINVEQVMLRPVRFTGIPAYRTESGVLQELLKALSPYDLIKHADIHATWLYRVFQRNKWLELKARNYFNDGKTSVAPFVHHDSVSTREFRSVEGLEIEVFPDRPDDSGLLKANTYTRISRFIREEIAPLWDEVRMFTQDKVVLSDDERKMRLYQMGQKYQLPDEILLEIARIKPTERQIKGLLDRNLSQAQRGQINSELIRYASQRNKWTMQFHKHYAAIESGTGSYEDLELLITSLQKLQLYDSPWNKGHNMPGVPGFVITHNKTLQGTYKFMVGLLLSQKALMEAWTGGVVVRS